MRLTTATRAHVQFTTLNKVLTKFNGSATGRSSEGAGVQPEKKILNSNKYSYERVKVPQSSWLGERFTSA
jgi:hypothetical protein